MNEFMTVLGAVLPVFCLAGAGALMRKLGVGLFNLPCSLELKRVIVLQAAMPAAVFPS